MTTATEEGRQLVLTVPGIEPFRIDPLPGRRGRALTELFVRMSRARLTGETFTAAEQETAFIESMGARNYARMTGLVVDQFDQHGEYVCSWTDAGEHQKPEHIDIEAEPIGEARFVGREAFDGEPESDGEPMRQSEYESIALCAFYWQTVVGMEAVTAFIEAGEGTDASVKALTLLLSRTVASRPTNSSSVDMVLSMEQGGSTETTATASSSGSVRLPAARRGFMQNGRKPKRSRR